MTPPPKSREERDEAKRAAAAAAAREMADLTDDSVTEEQVSQINVSSQERDERQATAPHMVPLADIDTSPYQPVGRPSSTALRKAAEAIEAAGSLAALVRSEGDTDTTLFTRLDEETKELALLAADIESNGVEQPLEVRTKGARYELLSGHRRLAAARLAKRADVPVVVRQVDSDSEAALIVFRRNQHRTDFTHWQQARRLSALRAQRNAERAEQGHGPERQDAFAAAAGISVGLLNQLLSIAAGFTVELLHEIGDGDPVRAEEALSRENKAWLFSTARITDPKERALAVRLKTARASAGTAPQKPDRPSGGSGDAPSASEPAHSLLSRSKGRGPVLDLRVPVERMSRLQADALKADLVHLRKKVDARLKALEADPS